MKIISSKLFYGTWLDTVYKRKDELLKDWRNPKAYTHLIKGMDGAIVDDLAQKLDLLCYEKDNYSLDVTFYDENDLTPGIAKGTYWFRQISIAFEHENFFNSGLFQEVSHLLILNTGLKVLVTYPNGETTAEMNYLHGIISGVHNSEQLSNEESFLLVFGYENNYEWEGFVFKKEGWKELDNNICLATSQKHTELQRITKAKNEAISKNEFEMAATLRDKERVLLEELKGTIDKA
jgi:hypothetical protein